MKLPIIALALTATMLPFGSVVLAQSAADKGKEMFDKIDTNHDGVLTLAEWTAAGRRERGFNIIDADHDGNVTPAELRAAAAKFGR